MNQVRISDSVIYNSAFSPVTAFGADAGTVAVWNFNEGSGSTVYDSSGNGYDGTIDGATWIEDCPE